MATIYELDDVLTGILAVLDEVGADTATVEAAIQEYFSVGDMAEKVDSYCSLIRELEARAEARKSEAARLSEKAKTASNGADRLRFVLHQLMAARNMKKIETPRFTVSRTAPRPLVVITDETAIPDTFWRIQRSVDKVALMSALKSGQNVQGATLGEGQEGLAIR